MIAAMLLAASVTATPAEGAGIQSGNVCLAQTAQPGQSYPLGVYVQDTGTGPESMVLAGGPLPSGDRLYRDSDSLPSSWLGVSYGRSWFATHHSVSLAAGQGDVIPVTLSVPAGAPSGLYTGELTVSTVTPAGTGSAGVTASLGPAAMTYVIFSVDGAMPSCSTPPPAGAPYSTDYAPVLPSEQTVTTAWLEKHEPWVFTKATAASSGTGTPAAAPADPAATPAAGSKISTRNIEGIAGSLLVVLVIARLRKKKAS